MDGVIHRVKRLSAHPGTVQHMADTTLSELDRGVLGLERCWWKHSGAKNSTIRELLDISPTRYYQVLGALLDNPAAIAAEPLLVARLRRVREVRRGARSVAPLRG